MGTPQVLDSAPREAREGRFEKDSLFRWRGWDPGANRPGSEAVDEFFDEEGAFAQGLFGEEAEALGDLGESGRPPQD